jgi:hypothetical protein
MNNLNMNGFGYGGPQYGIQQQQQPQAGAFRNVYGVIGNLI